MEYSLRNACVMWASGGEGSVAAPRAAMRDERRKDGAGGAWVVWVVELVGIGFVELVMVFVGGLLETDSLFAVS